MENLCSIDGCDEQHFRRTLCSKHYYRWWRSNHLEEAREYAREYSKMRYEQTPALEHARRDRYNNRYPEKVRAHQLLRAEIRKGTITKMACQECGAIKVYAHHDNYGKPLKVLWLCGVHHSARHKYLESINHNSYPTPEEYIALFAPKKLGNPTWKKGK